MSPILTVVPIASNVSKVYPFDVYLEDILERPSKAQANQVRTVSKERLLGPAIGRLPPELVKELDTALRLHLAL